MKNILKKHLSFLLTLIILLSAIAIPSVDADAASVQTVYVLERISTESEYDSTIYEITYNKAGFIKKFEDKYFGQKWSYTYDSNNNIKKTKKTSNSSSTVSNTTFTYKNGKMVKENTKILDYKSTTKYTWKKNRIVKSSVTSNSRSMGKKTSTYTYTYDKNGYIKSKKTKLNGRPYTVNYKNTYKNGRITKHATSEVAYVFHYKKISVPKKNVSKIKRQQWYFVNGFCY